jgi:hypothetical protein
LPAEDEDGSYSRLQQLQHVQEMYDRHKREFERLLARLEKVDKFGFFLDPVPPPLDECYYDPPSPKPAQAVEPPPESNNDGAQTTTVAPPPGRTSTPVPQVTLELEGPNAVSAAAASAPPSTPMHAPVQPSAAAAVSSPLDFLASAAAAVGTPNTTATAAAAAAATTADTNAAVAADADPAAVDPGDAALMPPKKKARRRPPASKAPARAALVFPDHAPFNWAMVRRRMEHGRYVLDREKYLRGHGGRRVAGMRRKALPPLHRLGVDWDLFVKDVVGMCDTALENDRDEDEEEEDENVVDGEGRDNGGAEAGGTMLDGDTEKSNLGGTTIPALPKSPPRLERGSLGYAVKLIKDVRTGGPCFANDVMPTRPHITFLVCSDLF